MAKLSSIVTLFLLLGVISTAIASREATVDYEWKEYYSSPVPTTTTYYYNPYEYQPTSSPPPQYDYYYHDETPTPSSPEYYHHEETPSSPEYYHHEETPSSPEYYHHEETPTQSSPQYDQHEETPTPPSPQYQHEETPTPPSPEFQHEETPTTSTTSEKYQFLAPQNAARRSLGLTPLRWDDTLAAYAQSWANQRRYDCAMIHSDTSYGENIWWGSSSGYTARYAVQSWVDERKWYDYNSNSCTNGQDCGHYTQIVWSTSTKVGCARVVCDNNGGVFVTCNYDPPGNIIGGKPY